MRQRLEQSAAFAAKGFCMGAADVVPGVSGGTMAFILGIYTRLIDAIKSFDTTWLASCLRLDWRTALTRPDFVFLLPLLTGIFAAILFFTRVIPLPRLLISHPEHVYGVFFGLICGSIVVLVKEFGGIGWRDCPAFAAGLLLGALVVTAVPTSTPETWWFVMLAGGIAICAMVVPGISGSFVLLLLGKYAYVLDALGRFRMEVILPFAAGAALGLFGFTRALSWLLHRHERVAMIGISGVLVASLWVIWPFQTRTFATVRGKSKLVDSNPTWPVADGSLPVVLTLMAAGFGAVIALQHFAARRAAEEPSTPP